MSVVGEVVGIVACVAAVISAYRDGGQVIEKIKLKRAQKRAAPPSRLLEESVDQAPEDIEREKRRGVNRFGKQFEKGDHIAIIALQQITIQLQGTLLEELRTAAFDDAHTDFRHLVDVADSGRDSTVDTLIQLRQRLLVAEPIAEISSSGAFPAITPTVSHRQSLPAPAPERVETKQTPTWTKGYSASRDASGDEDTASGAENSGRSNGKHKRHGSLFEFFKHQRTNSHEKSHSRTPSTVGEHDRRSLPPTTQPSSNALTQQRTRPSIAASPGRSSGSGQQHQAQVPSFTYNEWEDNLAEIWSDMPEKEHRESVSTVQPPSPKSTSSTIHRPSIASSFMRHPTISVPAPTAENNYLGFCKGAVRLQNGDRKAMEKRQDFHNAYSISGYAQPSVKFLACYSNKCAFASRGNVDTVWDRVWKVEAQGLQFRWPFLAKSHVVQKTVKGQAYAYQCLFCAYAGEQTPVYQGADMYIAHVATHRGPMGDVLLYKAGCINDRICDESEEFDINFFPLSSGGARNDSRVSQVLSDDLMGLGLLPSKPQSVAQDSMFSANEPWNEGLSDFHYGGGMDRTELE